MKTGNTVNRRLCLEELEPRWVPSAPTTSTNWSGYAVNSSPGSVSAVSGKWTVPTVTGSGTAYSSAWVGIDGFSSSTVEQTGTEQDVYNGVAQYSAWYEMYPNAPVTLNMAIHPGDVMSASVTYTGAAFTLNITDTTTGQSFMTSQGVPGAQRSSAEWIAEAPSSFSGVLPLANFGKVNFTNAQTTINNTTGPIDNAAWANEVYQINMVNRSGATIAATGALMDSSSGSAFTVFYGASTNPTPPPPPGTPPPSPGGTMTTTTTLTARVNPWSWVPSVTFTAVVSASAHVPTGSEVDLMYNGHVLARGLTRMVHGVEEATFTVYFYSPGVYTFSAVFVGSGMWASSPPSNSITVTVY